MAANFEETVVAFLIIVTQILTVLFYLGLIGICAHFTFRKTPFDQLRDNRLSLKASFCVGILWFFIPLIAHGGKADSVSWGFFVTAVKPFSFAGLVFWGIIGFTLGFGVVKITRRTLSERKLVTTRFSLSLNIDKSLEQNDSQQSQMTFAIPPHWLQTPQFLITALTGISAILIFYFLFGDKNTSNSVINVALGMSIGILTHMMQLNGNKLSALFWDD